MTTTSEANDNETVVAMVPCDDCGHLVPEANLAIHQATACGARARRPSNNEEEPPSPAPVEEGATNLGLRQRRPWGSPTRRAAPSVEWFTPAGTATTAAQPSTATAVSGTAQPGTATAISGTATATTSSACLKNDDTDTVAPSGTAATAAAQPGTATAVSGTAQPGTATAISGTATARPGTATTSAGSKNDDTDNATTVPDSPGVLNVGDMVDLTSDTPSTEQQTHEWACPRCTLLNPKSEGTCNACQYQNPDIVRPADPIRRERLVQDFGTPPPFQRNSLPSSATSGAILGGVLGAANAYMGGRSVGGGVLEGAMTGLVGGALVGEVLRDMSSEQPQPSVASARSGASMGLPTYPSMNGNGNSNRRRMQPRPSVRVVRHGNGLRGYSTTIYTNGSEFTRAGNDPLLHLMMQSLLTAPGHGGVDGMSYEDLLQAFGDGTEHLGAEEGTIQSLPTATVKDPAKELPPDQRQCCICLEDFQSDDVRKTLPCLHGFHKDCVDKWLRSNGSCPICKHSVT